MPSPYNRRTLLLRGCDEPPKQQTPNFEAFCSTPHYRNPAPIRKTTTDIAVRREAKSSLVAEVYPRVLGGPTHACLLTVTIAQTDFDPDFATLATVLVTIRRAHPRRALKTRKHN
jgi:hypothetical protein